MVSIHSTTLTIIQIPKATNLELNPRSRHTPPRLLLYRQSRERTRPQWRRDSSKVRYPGRDLQQLSWLAIPKPLVLISGHRFQTHIQYIPPYHPWTRPPEYNPFPNTRSPAPSPLTTPSQHTLSQSRPGPLPRLLHVGLRAYPRHTYFA